MKTCGNCKKSKATSDFNWKSKIKNLRHSVCRACHAAYKRNHYLSKRTLYITKARKWNAAQRLRLQKVVAEYLGKHPCVDCGETDIVVLDFDHKSDKIKEISGLIQSYCSIDSLFAEINKCEVRCANCHRRKTARDRGFWKMKMGA